MVTLTADEILASLDLDAVESAILLDESGKPALLAHDFEDAKRMVWAAASKWLVSDLNMLSASSLGIEERFEITLDGYVTRGFLDLRGEYKKGYEENGTPLTGRVLIADWKSTSGDLDLNWEKRLIDSKQWRLYASVPPGADFISYRGVNTKGKVREVYIKAYTVPDLAASVTNYFGGIGSMITAVSDRETWPQNMPGACGQYGQTCPFLEGPQGCRSGQPPKYLLDPKDIQLSYSGAGRFLGCPEKFRRMKQAAPNIDGTDATRLGLCVHHGIEEVYKQSFKKYGE